MSTQRLQEMMDYIEENNLFIHGIVVVRNGYIVWEEYPDPVYDAETPHLLFSVTKSFTSCLVGIAIDEGYIEGVDETMVSFFNGREIENTEGGKEQVTVEQLLMMRSGMDWDESSAPYTSPGNDVYHINHGDGLQYCLDLLMVAESGELWHYNTGSSHILSGIIQSSTEQTTLEYANERLFGPLGIEGVIWARDMGGTYKGGFDLQLTPREMAKFGYLYLNGGEWDGDEVIPRGWVEASTSSLTSLSDETGYGYQWWTMPQVGVFYASGLYSQGIFVSPEEDIVFVITAGLTPSQYGTEHFLMEDFVLASVTDSAVEPLRDESEPETRKGIPGFPLVSITVGVILALMAARKSK
jgi:CubicO group peptidase (beta-lactamase class C family)